MLRCRLLRTLSTLAIWSTMEVLPIYVHRAIPRSVYPCISSVIVLLLILSIWMISNYHRCDVLPMNHEIWGECSLTNVATFECGDICGNRRWCERWSQQLALMPAVQANASRSTLVGSPPGVINIWAVSHYDVQLTYFADVVSVYAFIITMVLFTKLKSTTRSKRAAACAVVYQSRERPTVFYIKKKHVHGFFDTALRDSSWHVGF